MGRIKAGIGALGGGFNATQQGAQQMRQVAPVPADGWKCACGAVATGKLCIECGDPFETAT